MSSRSALSEKPVVEYVSDGLGLSPVKSSVTSWDGNIEYKAFREGEGETSRRLWRYSGCARQRQRKWRSGTSHDAPAPAGIRFNRRQEIVDRVLDACGGITRLWFPLSACGTFDRPTTGEVECSASRYGLVRRWQRPSVHAFIV